MAKPRIIIADIDLNYIIPLQLKFAEEFIDKIDLEIITDEKYFIDLFLTPQKADVLVVSDSLYNMDICRHNISNIFLLTESSEECKTENLSVTKIFKYTSLKSIFNEIISKSSSFSNNTENVKETKVIVMYSPIGGAGKTTMALGLSGCLTSHFKKVLYINAEHINSFQEYLANKSTLPDIISTQLSTDNKDIYKDIKHYIRNEGFDYLPPLRVSISSLGIKYSIFKHLIECVKKAKEYDFIVLDIESAFTDESVEIFEIADKIILITMQDKASVFKMQMFLNNVNCNDDEKYMFICNKFNKNESNEIININKNIIISQYINNIDKFEMLTVQDFIKIEENRKLAFTLI